MKKIKQLIPTVLPSAKIFFDDLEEIDKIIQESCSTYNITFNEFNKSEYELNSINVIEEIDKLLEESYSFYTITLDDKYELDSINEINEVKEIEEKQDFHKLKIRLTKPYFRLQTDEFSTEIYSDDDALCIGITERIKPIIQKRRKPYFEVEPYLFKGVPILLIFALFLLILPILNPSLESYINLYSAWIEYMTLGVGILLIIFLIIFTISMSWENNGNKFIVFTAKKSNEQNNLFIKNKDQIILSSISAAIGALLITLFTWFRVKLTGQ